MSLPPLPNPSAAGSVEHPLYTIDQMKAYGQQCREAALEEAAKAIKEPIGYDNYTAMSQAAAKIRGLK